MRYFVLYIDSKSHRFDFHITEKEELTQANQSQNLQFNGNAELFRPDKKQVILMQPLCIRYIRSIRLITPLPVFWGRRARLN